MPSADWSWYFFLPSLAVDASTNTIPLALLTIGWQGTLEVVAVGPGAGRII
jgi:hypothetical protein